jgi:hypothetical protein
VVAAIVLVAIPSLFGIFPEMGRWGIGVRVSIAGVWIGIVMASVIIGSRRDVRLGRILDTTARQREQLRLRATDDILTALLRPGTKDIPSDYEFTVYLREPEPDQLRAAFPAPGPGAGDVAVFRSGDGATGLAFQRRQLILVTGDAVSDGTYGLTPGQREHFASYRVVVATPIWREGDRPIGVLSAINRENDGHFEKDSSRAALRELAEVIGVVLTSVYGAE